HGGVAGNASTMTLAWRDSPSPGLTYAFGAALGNTGFTIGNRLVPLDPDFLLIGTFATSVAPWSTGFLGTLDASGEAQGTLANPGGLLNGFVVYVGAFTLDPAAPFGVRTIANSFAVEFQ
ncbi:MAG TPA: hypothetical protein VK348_03255, partial [Planctomycetota bacterium]|nr:hypothetical protein [Planctomycetota bacterium]